MGLKSIFRFMVLPGIVFLLFGFSQVVAEGPTPQIFARDSTWNQTYSMGMTLYNEKCMVCHGEDGEGKIGLPLNLQSFLSIASMDYLIKSIAHGRPTRGMPEFGTMMNDEEINAVALYVKGWQFEPSKEVESGVVVGDPLKGKDWYRGICANCHGVRGEGGPNVGGGGHVIASFAAFSGPALADPGFQKSATDGFIKATLMYGRIGTPMASYLKGNQGAVDLTEEEINDIVAFIRSMPPVKAAKKGVVEGEKPAEEKGTIDKTTEGVKKSVEDLGEGLKKLLGK